MDRQAYIQSEFTGAIQLLQQVADESAVLIEQAAQKLGDCLASGGKILIFGNGGSAADAQHFAGELVGRYLRERPALAAIALTTDSSVLTAIANDYGYQSVFARQIEALAKSGDMVIGFSTSGRSPNFLAGLSAARRQGLFTLALVGADPSACSDLADILISIPSRSAPRIQEAHAVILHILCDLIERQASARPGASAEGLQ